ncbi:potassium transporter [Lyophyllum atratum]|nr:potassium transporter [Lyophyllum atratum]
MSATPETLEKGINLTSKREAVSPRGPPLLFLSFQALGIIYSDIGTSPLYVLNGLGPATGDVPPQEDVIGGISAIIWSLTLLPLIKYVSISLRFGTEEGEGGSFALFQGLSPQVDKDYDADRTFTGDSFEKSLTRQPGGRRINKKFRWPMLIWALLGTSYVSPSRMSISSLTMADGVFTSAVSVTSAVGGIAVAKKSVSGDITSISVALL